MMIVYSMAPCVAQLLDDLRTVDAFWPMAT